MRVKPFTYLLVAAFLIFSFVGWYYYNNKNYHTQLSIQYTPANIPITRIGIEDKTYFFEIDLGSKFPLTLRKSLLEEINYKKFHGTGNWKDAKGNAYEAPSYLVPKIKLGNQILNEVLIQQEDDDYLFNTTLWDEENKGKNIVHSQYGSIGWPLLTKNNLLIDLQNSTIILSNDTGKLKEAGYNLNELTAVPIELTSIGIILQAKTDLGTQRFLLDTGSTLNLIEAHLVENQKCTLEKHGLSLFTTSFFILNNQDFGRLDLHPYPITPTLGINGILGIPFLKDHIVYLDFSSKVAYLGAF